MTPAFFLAAVVLVVVVVRARARDLADELPPAPLPKRPVSKPPRVHRVRVCGTEMDGSWYWLCSTCGCKGGSVTDRRLAEVAGREHEGVEG